MTEARYYLLMCPNNYFSLKLDGVAEGAADPAQWPCPMTDHGPHDVQKISYVEYRKRVRINAPNAGNYAYRTDELPTVNDPQDAPQPGDETAARDVLGNVYEPPTAIPDPQQTPDDHTGQVDGAVSPDSTFDPPASTS